LSGEKTNVSKTISVLVLRVLADSPRKLHHRRIIFKWILKAERVRVWPGISWLRMGKVGALINTGNEPSCYIKFVNFLIS